MANHIKENVLRLAAAAGLSLNALHERAGLDERTIRGILRDKNKPHLRTVKKLAEGLGVAVDELFLDPARLVYRSIDRWSNAVIDEIIELNPDLFDDWTETDFVELYSQVGEGGSLTREGAIDAISCKNWKRNAHAKLDVILESDWGQLAAEIIEILFKNATTVANKK